MRACSWSAPLMIAVALSAASVAHAESRTTSAAATVYKAAGEKSAVVARLPAGATVEVVGAEGRWLRVKVKGAVGYLARTQVTEPAAPVAPPAWSKPRRGLGADQARLLRVAVTRATDLRGAPQPGASTVGPVAAGVTLVVVDGTTVPGWIEVRDPGGKRGWIERGAVGNGTAAAAVEGRPGPSEGGVARTAAAGDDGFTRRPPGAHGVRAEARLAYVALGKDFTSDAGGGLSNYLVDADAAALLIEVAARRARGRWWVGAEAGVELGAASPGLDYPGPTAPPGKIPFQTFAVDIAARAGRRLAPSLDLGVRVGGHYDAFLPSEVENAGMLPHERLLGLAVGLELELTPPRSRVSASVRAGGLVWADRAQTPGLEDGARSDASALGGGVRLRYALAGRWHLAGGVELRRASTRWSGPSVRQPGVTSARRIDTTQLLQLGMAAEF